MIVRIAMLMIRAFLAKMLLMMSDIKEKEVEVDSSRIITTWMVIMSRAWALKIMMATSSGWTTRR